MHRLVLRNRYLFILDTLILLTVPILAMGLRIDAFPFSVEYLPTLYIFIIVGLVVRLSIFHFSGLYRQMWRYASIDALSLILVACFISTVLMTLLFFAARAIWPSQLPRSLPLIDGLLVLIAIGGTRFSIRYISAWRNRNNGTAQKRVLIMGAGDAGVMIAREIRNSDTLSMQVVGFLDDNPNKHNVNIVGIPVLGGREAIPRFVASEQIDQVIIAMPTAPGKSIRDIARVCESADVETKIIPGMYELLDGTANVSQLRNVEIEDLLRRESVVTDTVAVGHLLTGKRVLITGGGGSIGSELCRQIMRHKPQQLVILGHGENSVFVIRQELHSWMQSTRSTTDLQVVIADVRFADRITTLFNQYQPQIVFHTAAHKHVPLMEMNPPEAVTNNVLGTRNLLNAATAVNVEHFVMISTDKAVNPTSIMGASKRTAELLVHDAARRTGKPYVAVRFGNVLGSRGSVVLTFKQQIAAGGPVTVTHPDMTRYFMTIPEAVQLVLQASVMGEGGEVFVLDMGNPVKIVDLARDLIKLSGLELGYDIDIEYSGIRPGEKLFEELFVTGENYKRTHHDKIYIAGNASTFVPQDLASSIGVLDAAAARGDIDAIYRGFRNLIPEYQPHNSQNFVNSDAVSIERTPNNVAANSSIAFGSSSQR